MTHSFCTCKVCLEAQKRWMAAANDVRTGSTVDARVPVLPLPSRNSVIEARIRTSLSARTSSKAESRVDIWTQSMTWADFIEAREATLRVVMLRRTFASPMMETKSDILCLGRSGRSCTYRKSGNSKYGRTENKQNRFERMSRVQWTRTVDVRRMGSTNNLMWRHKNLTRNDSVMMLEKTEKRIFQDRNLSKNWKMNTEHLLFKADFTIRTENEHWTPFI